MSIDIKVYVGGMRQKFIDGSAPSPAYLETVFSLVHSAAKAEEEFGDDELEQYAAEQRLKESP